MATKEEVKKVYLLKYYYVFNVNDIEGLPQKKGKEQDIPQDMPVVKEVDYKNKVKHALEFVKQWNNIVPIKHGNYNPCYSPINDTIYMPYFSHFEDKNKIEEYFSTLFHEIVHSTGHQSRLDRIKHNKIGDWHYSLEELTAEIGSSMLMNMYGLDIPEVFQNNVAYINFWLQQLNNDKTLIIKAAGRAETAVEYVLQKTKFGENEVEKPKEVATA
ncbi:zincin-like metallopeptidase domain-containing protein [Caldicellulosiruptor danielii]|uniref:Zincin-like metallopeptidase domain-containing protein n=1 Tax=Anaerocellum danielii TaxID=1387557 RepID=A0ABZ0TY20_9FIRM|nr:zincin-like metallopeptidase domain-containing protein [Caldicellulosiruptor danielii]WPX08119.1 zincin-like metallopeptidase domain-containing protein [Caldicellulosiruptor danielii]